jgi:hypothetical protein
MTASNLDAYLIGGFVLNMKNLLGVLKNRRTELHNPQSCRPLLHLKCWGSDYPYLQAPEQQRRWLPTVLNSKPPALDTKSKPAFR